MEPPFHTWREIMAAAIVPVVIISACGLLCLAFYNRLAMVITRLRTLQRERLGEYKELFRLEEKGERSSLRQEEAERFLHYLEQQTSDVLKRARYLRNCLFCLIAAIFTQVLTSLAIGVSFLYSVFDLIALFFFIGGLVLFLVGLFFAILEIKVSLSPIQMESGFVHELIKSELGKKGLK